MNKIEYKTDEIIDLNDYQHIRLKNNMYSGDKTPHTQEILVYKDGVPSLKEVTWVPALYTAWREIVDNALDEIIGFGYGNRIDITYDPNQFVFGVSDNGRGIPIDWDEDRKIHKATLALTRARAGRNFGSRGEVAGTNGIGASATVFCSAWFKVEITRDNKKFVQEFNEGTPLMDKLIIKKPKITDSVQDKSGTKITFSLSRQVFETQILPEEYIYSRVYEIAACNPLLHVYYNGARIKVKPQIEKTLFGDKNPIIIDLKEKEIKSKFILVPDFTEAGETIHTVINNIYAINGGIHIESFRRMFYSGLLNALEKESKRRKLTPNKSDINEGLLIYNVTNMTAPDFDSQHKTRLAGEAVGNFIKSKLEDENIFKEIIKKNKEWIDKIYERCAARTQKKDAAEVAKLAKKVSRNKVARLMDATSKNRQECILVLAEGVSAISGVSSVRNPEIHGGLGLKGKVLNVHGESPKKILDNTELADIMNSIGLTIGEVPDRANLRYGKVYIAHDADPDGYNIGALLINFFYTFWPSLFDKDKEPFIYVFNTPFIIVSKDKQRKYWYNHNYSQFIPETWKGWNITRAKGLGTLTRDDWKHSLDNPDLYPILDDSKIKESLDLLFNNDRSNDRKTWMGI